MWVVPAFGPGRPSIAGNYRLAVERSDIRFVGFVPPFRAKLMQNQMPSLDFGADQQIW